MALNFVAVDFETANLFRGSPCAVGLTVVCDGAVVGSHERLIHQTDFHHFNIAIHGITPEQVTDADPFPAVWEWMLEVIDGAPLVAHNAAFDTGVIRDALSANGLPWTTLTYACTLVMGRRTYDLTSYRLPFVAQAAGVPLAAGGHHKALHDADAAARIMVDIAQRHDVDDLGELAKTMYLQLGHINADAWSGCRGESGLSRAGFTGSVKDITINADADPENPLYGMGVTFTGTLGSMTRALAWAKVAECGGMPLDGVTKKTNLLVFGHQDASRLAPGQATSAKFTKAEALKAKGADIEIIGEDDFLALLQEASISVN